RVEPDVDRLLGIAGEGDPPGNPLGRDRDVLEPGLEQSHELGPPDRPLRRQGAGPDQAQNLVAVTAQAEEVVLLPGAHELEMWMLLAVPIDDLRLLLELLTAGAIEPFVFSDEDVAWIPLADALDQRDRRAVVARLRCADPVVVGAEEPAPGRIEPLGQGTHPLRRRHPRLLRCQRHLLGVLVHAHEEMHRVTAQTAVPGDAVGAYLLQGMTEMRLAIG